MQGRRVCDGSFEHSDYDGLALAIICTAASDYVLCREWLELHPERKDDSYKTRCRRWHKQDRLKEVMSFFRSGWYRALTKVEADYIIGKLEERIARELEEWEQSNI